MPSGFLNMALLRRTRRKGLVLLAIICLTSSTILRICIQGEKIYLKYGQDVKTDRPIDDGAISPDRIMVRHVLNATQTTPSDSRITYSNVPFSSCTDSVHCTDLLSSEEYSVYKHCTTSSSRHLNNISPSFNGPCRFINGSRRRPIALASFPGSGNTWARGLLQLATGLCTGSIYCDRDLRRNGFVGEGLYTGSVLVTKTHRPNCKVKNRQKTVASEGSPSLNFTKAILIIRNPFHAIISERNRQSAVFISSDRNDKNPQKERKHLATAGEDYFGSHNEEWNRFILAKIKWWKSMIHFWLVKFSKPVLVVRYEELKRDSIYQIKRMLSFIDYREMSDEELRNNLKDGFNTYHRKHSNTTNNTNTVRLYYTSPQIQTINQYIKLIDNELIKNNKTHYNILLNSYLAIP